MIACLFSRIYSCSVLSELSIFAILSAITKLLAILFVIKLLPDLAFYAEFYFAES